MSRYIAFARPPRSWTSDTHEFQSRPTCEVLEADKSPVDTGLVTAAGVPLYRVEDTVPMGFRHRY